LEKQDEIQKQVASRKLRDKAAKMTDKNQDSEEQLNRIKNTTL
jgi:hypothetical protein